MPFPSGGMNRPAAGPAHEGGAVALAAPLMPASASSSCSRSSRLADTPTPVGWSPLSTFGRVRDIATLECLPARAFSATAGRLGAGFAAAACVPRRASPRWAVWFA
jgi:hypothetical protein